VGRLIANACFILCGTLTWAPGNGRLWVYHDQEGHGGDFGSVANLVNEKALFYNLSRQRVDSEKRSLL
jgi:hypothetical protein